MKAALIAPFGYEDTVLVSTIHLVLPLVETLVNDRYVAAYMRAKQRGDYLIMDNGAAEGRLRPTEVLINCVETFEADELVAPDVLGETAVTHDLVQQFLQELELIEAIEGPKPFAVQAVLQGFKHDDRAYLLDYYAQQERITVIGIPKVTIAHGSDGVRARIAEYIQSEYPNRFKIHLLGASPNFPAELARVDFPTFIRSTDSALPYKAAAESVRMTEEMPHPKRWEGYFSEKRSVDLGLLTSNIHIYQHWAARHEG